MIRERGRGSGTGRRFAHQRAAVAATDHRLLAPERAAGIARVKSAKSIGVRSGKLAHPPAGAGAPERAGHHDQPGLARPRYHRHAARLRARRRCEAAALTDGRASGAFTLAATGGTLRADAWKPSVWCARRADLRSEERRVGK